jgi:type IV pilus assembly protein PilA
MFNLLKSKKGFTLVELMVVVVILGILVAIAVPMFNASTAKAEKNAIDSNLRIIDGAITMYSANNDGAVPADDAADATAPTSLSEYIKEWPEGPGATRYGITSGAAITN